MMDHILEFALHDSHVEGVHNQLGPQVVLHGPSYPYGDAYSYPHR